MPITIAEYDEVGNDITIEHPTARVVSGTGGVLAVGKCHNRDGSWGPEWHVIHVASGRAVDDAYDSALFRTRADAAAAARWLWEQLTARRRNAFRSTNPAVAKNAVPARVRRAFFEKAE